MYEPLALSVKKPPAEPATGCPTDGAVPFTARTLRLSPSGSASLASTPPEAATLNGSPSTTLAVSATATGAGFVMAHWNELDTVPKAESVAVTVIV